MASDPAAANVVSQGTSSLTNTDSILVNGIEPSDSTEANQSSQTPLVPQEARTGAAAAPSGKRAALYKIETFTDRYEGFFELRLIDNTKAPTEVEGRFLKLLNGTLGNISSHIPKESSQFSRDIKDARAELVVKLTEQVTNFLNDGNDLSCYQNIVALIARYQENLRHINLYYTPLRVVNDPETGIDEIKLNLLKMDISDEQQKLIIEIEKSLIIVDVVLRERSTPAYGYFAPVAEAVNPDRDKIRKDEIQRRNYYVQKLADVARNGLAGPSKIPYANASLEAFKNEFVAREADMVKNRYVRFLGRRAAFYGAIFFALYCIFRYWPGFIGYSGKPEELVLFRYKEFFALAAGACAGTWLSFAIRRVILGFTDLALLEDDRLKPTSRIFFVVGLTIVVGMLLKTHMVGFDVGGTSVTLTSGLFAILIGTLCGISERALTNVVSHRADDFAGRIGGQQKPAG